MLFKSLFAITVAAATVSAAPHAVKRFDSLPVSLAHNVTDDITQLLISQNEAQIWVQTQSGDTEAFLTSTGEAFHWADENGDPDAPQINTFNVHVYPGQPEGSEDVLISLSNGEYTCRFTPDEASFLNCNPDAPGDKEAVIRAKVMKDPIGETRWVLLGGYSSWSVTDAPESGDLYWKVSNKPTGLAMNLYLEAPAL